LAAQLSADDFVEIAMLCELERDGPVTVAAVSLGQVDLAIRAIELAWIK
jgi:hypothetical protein